MNAISKSVVLAVVAAMLAPIIAITDGGVPATAAVAIDRMDADQVGVAVAYSQRANADASGPVVYLANAENTAEGLSAGAAAAARRGVVLWTPAGSLDPRVADELYRLQPSEVVIMAGTRGVSGEVVAAVRGLGFPVVRIAKSDRFSASRAIVQGAFARASTVYVVSGWRPEDAAIASAAAAHAGAPVLAVNGTHWRVDDLTVRLLRNLGVTRIIIVGSTSSVKRAVVEGLRPYWPSITRYGASESASLSTQVARARFAAAESAVLATPGAAAGAIAVSARGAVVARPTYVIEGECVPAAVLEDLNRLAEPPTIAPGDTAAIPESLTALVACFDPAADAAALQGKLTDALASLPGTNSITVHVLGEGARSVSVGGSTAREPASVIKLFAAYVILARIDSGQFSLDTRTRSGVAIRDCLRVMIHISDNLCHADLLALVGNDAINRDLYRAGFTRTYYVGTDGSGVYRSAKKSTTDDIAALLKRLYAGTLLSPDSTSRLQGLLDEQLWKSKIPSGVEQGVASDNKTGSLWTSTGMMQGDAGLVHAATAPYVIAVLGERNSSEGAIRRLSQVVHDHLEGEAETYMAYPDRNLITRVPTPYYSGKGTGRLGTIPEGARIIAESSSRTWYRVQYDGAFVFVDQKHVRTRY